MMEDLKQAGICPNFREGIKDVREDRSKLIHRVSQGGGRDPIPHLVGVQLTEEAVYMLPLDREWNGGVDDRL